MYNQPYFIPGYFSQTAVPTMMSGAMNGTMGRAMNGVMSGAMNGARLGAQGASRGLGLFSRLGNSLSAVRSINWGGLITNASKTLNVVNQAIPLVRQVGPMVNNMKSILKVASIFKDETDKRPTRQRSQTTSITNSFNSNNNYSYTNNSKGNNTRQTEQVTSVKTRNETGYNRSNEYDGAPTFFIGT